LHSHWATETENGQVDDTYLEIIAGEPGIKVSKKLNGQMGKVGETADLGKYPDGKILEHKEATFKFPKGPKDATLKIEEQELLDRKLRIKHVQGQLLSRSVCHCVPKATCHQSSCTLPFGVRGCGATSRYVSSSGLT
jgi:hypothetical protein